MSLKPGTRGILRASKATGGMLRSGRKTMANNLRKLRATQGNKKAAKTFLKGAARQSRKGY